MKKTIEVAGKPYTVECQEDGVNRYCCRILEIDQIYPAKYDEIEKVGISCVTAWNKHNAIWGMKNLRTKQFCFKFFGTSLRITFMSPYAAKAWFWHWYRSKNIKQFTVRLLGVNIYWAEANATEKLIKLNADKQALKNRRTEDQ